MLMNYSNKSESNNIVARINILYVKYFFSLENLKKKTDSDL